MTRVSLGRIVATPAALAALETAGQEAAEFLARHERGDWGDLDPEDSAANDAAVQAGDARLFSAYLLRSGVKVWIITEWDGNLTTILLPEDY